MNVNIQYFSEEIDKLLLDFLGPSLVFDEEDREVLVNHLAITIRCYDKQFNTKNLRIIVDHILNQKYSAKLEYVVEPDVRSDELTDVHLARAKRIRELKRKPQHEQRTDEWFKQRKECLTATAVAIALDEDPYKYPAELLLDKCGLGEPFVDNENVHHGRKYEQIANMFYAHVNDVRVSEYGLLQSDSHPFIGASPDGICERRRECGGVTELVGRLLEIKCPRLRRIKTSGSLDGDRCPHYYYVQVQTQLFVTGMQECDFLQCKIIEYDSWEEYKSDKGLDPWLTAKNQFKGCIIQLRSKTSQSVFDSEYIYPPTLTMTPKEIKKWIGSNILSYKSTTHEFDRIIYWRLEQTACDLIAFDDKWFHDKIPMLKQFWTYVNYYSSNQKALKKLHKYIQTVGISASKEIFERVHQDCPEFNEQLYSQPTPWRRKYDAIKARYR